MDHANEDYGFTFVWKIHKYSYCIQRVGECLRSPYFFVNNCKWSLNLFPRGTEETPDDTGIRLWKDDAEIPIKIHLVFSISTEADLFKETSVLECAFQTGSTRTIVGSLKVPVLQKRGNKFCNKDTLTVKCKIVKIDDVPLQYKKICRGYTVIDVHKTTYNWNVNTLSDEREKKFDTKELNLFNNACFTIDVSTLKGYSDEETFEIVIKQARANKLHFSSCSVFLLDAETILQSTRNEHWFEKSETEQVWTVSFTPTRKLMSFPQHDKYLRFEFAVSKGVESSRIENIEHGRIIELKASSNGPVICSKLPTESSRSWKDNLQRFHSEGTFNDVTIRTPTKEFPAHKAMLCAQSAVFTAMFERDMKENQTGVIDIDDLKDETISKMLLYIYVGSVDNLDWSLALDLYFAADKYRIEPLGEKCSDFLKENLSSGNVCECLMLADLHQDQQLKSVAQEFFMENLADIIKSEEWKNLMKENPSLAAETMHLLCLRNLRMS